MANVLSDVFQAIFPTAPPRVLKGPQGDVLVRGALYASRSSISIAAAHAISTLYPVFRLPATARLLGLYVAHDANTNLTDMDLGIYTAVDWSSGDGTITGTGDQYVDGLSFAAARNEVIDPAQILAGAIGSIGNCLGQGTNAVTGLQMGRRIFEDTGATLATVTAEPRPGTEYDLVWKAKVDPDAASTIVTTIIYTMGA